MSKRRSMFGAFKEWSDDLYVKQISPFRFHCIRVEFPEEWGDSAEEQYGKYYLDLSEVDVSALDWAHVCSILSSCGWVLEGHDDTGFAAISCPYDGTYVSTYPATTVRVIVDCAVRYGARAPLSSESGNNLQRCVRALVSESHMLCKDADEHEERMDYTRVNAIGNSAREYMTGDIGLRRYSEADKIATILRAYSRAK
jgi:hypothetical protein